MTETATARHATGAQERVRRILDRAVARQRGPAPLLATVRSPSLGIDVTVGDADLAFHAASVGKLVTGALVLRLADAGALDLDAPVIEVLGAEALRGLVVVDGHDHAAEVTARQLLGHTSGIPDAFEGRSRGSRTVAQLIVDEPDRRRSPEDVIEHSRRFQRAVGAPGARFAYSDTGFALLGLLVEALERRPFAEVVHSRVIDPLGLRRTWMPTHSAPADATTRLAPVLLGGTDLSRAASLSVDWAGGGIAATPSELATIVEAVHDGRLVSAPGLDAMSATSYRFRPGLRSGLAMMRVRFGEFSPFLRSLPDATGHLGVTAAHAWRIDALDATAVLGLGSDRAMVRSFRLLIDVVRALAAAGR